MPSRKCSGFRIVAFLLLSVVAVQIRTLRVSQPKRGAGRPPRTSGLLSPGKCVTNASTNPRPHLAAIVLAASPHARYREACVLHRRGQSDARSRIVGNLHADHPPSRNSGFGPAMIYSTTANQPHSAHQMGLPHPALPIAAFLQLSNLLRAYCGILPHGCYSPYAICCILLYGWLCRSAKSVAFCCILGSVFAQNLLQSAVWLVLPPLDGPSAIRHDSGTPKLDALAPSSTPPHPPARVPSTAPARS